MRLDELKRAEQEARAARRGIWRDALESRSGGGYPIIHTRSTPAPTMSRRNATRTHETREEPGCKTREHNPERGRVEKRVP